MVTTRPGVTLRDVTVANRDEIEALSVTAEQSQYVASVAESFQDAIDDADACPRYWGLYDGEQPVGFVMISDDIPPERTELLGPYYLWRLLIDTRFQHRGYGTAALDLVVEYVRGKGNADVLYTSHVPIEGPQSPLPFYLKYGFEPTGEIHDDEPVLALSLR